MNFVFKLISLENHVDVIALTSSEYKDPFLVILNLSVCILRQGTQCFEIIWKFQLLFLFVRYKIIVI